MARTHISGSFIQPVDVEVAYQRWPRSTLFHLVPSLLETPLQGARGRQDGEKTWLITRHGPLLLFITVMSGPSLCALSHFGLAGDQLTTATANRGVRVTRNWEINKRRGGGRDVSRLSSSLREEGNGRRDSLGLGGHIIGTEFERMRDTCINFTGRLVKLVPLRF